MPIPVGLHPGSGGIHNIEKQYGIWGGIDGDVILEDASKYQVYDNTNKKMDKNGDKIMSVKNELDNFFERFLAAYQKTEDGLPKRPRRKDVDQAVYVGEADNAGWCRWRPLAYGKEETFIKLLETYGIEGNRDIIEYFSTYHFLGFNVNYKKRGIGIDGVDPRDEYRSLKRIMEAYTDSNGRVTHIVIGTEAKVDYSVVVEIKTGIVKFVDDENGKMRKIAPSLEEFIKGWEPRV